MAYPAGFSSGDEDYDGFSFSSDSSRNLTSDSNDCSLVENPELHLIDAIINNNVDIVKKLLEDGIDVNFKSKRNGWSPLMYACSVGSKSIMSLLIQNGANVNQHQDMVTPLMCVCNSSSTDEHQLIECVELLVKHGAQVNAVNLNNNGCLAYAVKKNREKLVVKLIIVGCRLDQSDSSGRTPIFHAVSQGSHKLVQILKDAGARIDKLDRNYLSLHEIALSQHNYEIAELVKTEKVYEIDTVIEKRAGFKIGSYQYLLSEFPKTNIGRFNGFHTVAIKWIHGLNGLSHLTDLFIQKNIQLTQLLTMSNEDLINIGVCYSFDRKKIIFYIQKLLEHNWKNGINRNPKDIVVNLNIAVEIISNFIGQVQIVSTATYFSKLFLERNNQKLSRSMERDVKNGFTCVKLFRSELRTFHGLMKSIDKDECVTPSDYILAEIPHKKPLNKWVISCSFINLSAISLLIIYKCNHLLKCNILK